MNAVYPAPPRWLGRQVALHSVGWLAAANLVGVWLALCLLWPQLGELLVPLTYGRWVPLHLDWQLYGWCALPLVGMLLYWYLDYRHPRARGHVGVGLAIWSLSLGLGGLSWLGGSVSGKLFLDWAGWARPLLPLAMTALWTILAAHTWWRSTERVGTARVARPLFLVPLLAVPSLLYWSSGRDTFPPVDPDSGGATGASLLGSTLGIVSIFLLMPRLLRVAPRRRSWPFVAALVASWLVFAAIDHGDVSHHDPQAILALGVLLAWIPLLPRYWSCFEWPASMRPWLRAGLVWWALLVGSGWVSFLPGVSEAWKFTHALVAHAHLAMAGLVTSINAALLCRLIDAQTSRGVFWSWQLGCGLHVASLLVLGAFEAEHFGEMVRGADWVQAFLSARLVAGVAMTGASVGAFVSLLRS